MTSFTHVIPVSTLRAAITHAATRDKSRPYLESVFLDTSRQNIVATDGHRMLIVRALTDGGPSVIIPRLAIEQMLKALPSRPIVTDVNIVADVDGDGDGSSEPVVSWRFEFCNTRVAFEPINCTYPDYSRVLPRLPVEPVETTEPASQPALNPAYVLAADNALRILEGMKPVKIGDHVSSVAEATYCGSDTAALFTRPGISAVVLIMPMRLQPFATIAEALARLNGTEETEKA